MAFCSAIFRTEKLLSGIVKLAEDDVLSELVKTSKPKQTGLFIGGLMIGSAIGTAVGLLIAPRTGKETRKVIKKSADALPELAEDLGTSLQIQTDRLSSATSENWEGTLSRLRQAIAAGVETSRASQNTVKSDLTKQDLDLSTTDSF